jgi:hypothetical protein
MIAVLWILGISAYLVAYFAIGGFFAKRLASTFWAEARARYKTGSIVKDDAIDRFVICFLFWPIYLLATGLVSWSTQALEEGDPKRQEQEIAAARLRIEELERELGIR